MYTFIVHSVYLPFQVVKGYTRGMPHPAKTNAETILHAAIALLEEEGEAALSMRELASRLRLTADALYRYFPDRAALEAGMAEEGFRRLHAELVASIGKRVGKDALRVDAVAYLAFAQAHPAWYALMMRFQAYSPEMVEA